MVVCTAYFQSSLSSSSSTRFVIDDWLEFKFSDARVAQELLSTAQTLRSALDQLMTGRFQQTGDTMRMNVITSMCVLMNVISMCSECWVDTSIHPIPCKGHSLPSGNYTYVRVTSRAAREISSSAREITTIPPPTPPPPHHFWCLTACGRAVIIQYNALAMYSAYMSPLFCTHSESAIWVSHSGYYLHWNPYKCSTCCI